MNETGVQILTSWLDHCKQTVLWNVTSHSLKSILFVKPLTLLRLDQGGMLKTYSTRFVALMRDDIVNENPEFPLCISDFRAKNEVFDILKQTVLKKIVENEGIKPLDYKPFYSTILKLVFQNFFFTFFLTIFLFFLSSFLSR